MRFQQVSAPVTAKGLEDTAFYRYFPLLALNEVGGDPRRFGVSTAAFHHFNQERARDLPRAMLATATHDTKRGEDARMRLALLSELPREWRRRVVLWFRLNRLKRGEIEGRPAPARNDEYFFYQTLVGAWPPDLDPADTGAVAAFGERVAATMIKAVREGKEQSSWGNPNALYEAALQRFVASALDASHPNPFLADLAAFVARISRLSAINSLAQVTLKLTSPGVPDIYQGSELWDLSLVDPDNRRRVDFAARRRLLAEMRASASGAIPDPSAWADGREKLFLLWRLLALRADRAELFASGGYAPLPASGARSAHVCAFLRQHGEAAVAVVIPRLVARLYGAAETADWGDATVMLPAGSWRDVVTGRSHSCSGSIAVSRLLDEFPVTALVAERSLAAQL
jgi:(1->4)-alpha-D-glucan 1-alpha-D-glucosylmutase